MSRLLDTERLLYVLMTNQTTIMRALAQLKEIDIDTRRTLESAAINTFDGMMKQLEGEKDSNS